MRLTQRELDRMQCGVPHCDHKHDSTLVLHGRCHMESPTWVSYDRTTGDLEVACSTCGKTVALIAVSER